MWQMWNFRGPELHSAEQLALVLDRMWACRGTSLEQWDLVHSELLERQRNWFGQKMKALEGSYDERLRAADEAVERLRRENEALTLKVAEGERAKEQAVQDTAALQEAQDGGEDAEDAEGDGGGDDSAFYRKFKEQESPARLKTLAKLLELLEPKEELPAAREWS